METYWLLSENDWEYSGRISVYSEEKPTVTPSEDGNYRMDVDGVTIYFDEEIKEDKGWGEKYIDQAKNLLRKC